MENNEKHLVCILNNRLYKIGKYVVNPSKVDYAERNLEMIANRLEKQKRYISKIEQELADARNIVGLLNMMKMDIQENIISKTIPVKIVYVSNKKTGKIKESKIVTPEEAQFLIDSSNKWMLESTWETIYHNDTMVEV